MMTLALAVFCSLAALAFCDREVPVEREDDIGDQRVDR